MQASEANTAEMIEGLRARIQEWRGSKGKGRAMPEELWEEAAAAAQLLGVGRVAEVLNLSYDRLKRRAGLADAKRAAVGRSDFIELPNLSAPFASHLADEAVVEVLATDGAKLSVRVRARNLDMSALVNAFRSRV